MSFVEGPSATSFPPFDRFTILSCLVSRFVSDLLTLGSSPTTGKLELWRESKAPSRCEDRKEGAMGAVAVGRRTNLRLSARGGVRGGATKGV